MGSANKRQRNRRTFRLEDKERYTKMEAPGPPTNTIFCLYCRATIYFPGLPANRYLNHLFAEHNIMYEVQSVINRTLALQLPKEYPELADGSVSLPDSSNRLTSPAPSSDDGPSPAPGRSSPGSFSYMNSLDCGTQTEPINSSSISCQVERKREMESPHTNLHKQKLGRFSKGLFITRN